MRSPQGRCNLAGRIDQYLLLRELLVVFSSAVPGCTGSFLDACEEELSLFSFDSFGVAFGLQLGFAELGTSAVTFLISRTSVRSNYAPYIFRSSPKRVTCVAKSVFSLSLPLSLRLALADQLEVFV